MSQVVGLFVRVFNYGVYALVFEHVALGTWPQRVVGVGAGHRLLRFLLLLESPPWSRERGVLGLARGASPEPALQPVDGAAADQQRRVPRLDLLPADGRRGRATRNVRGGGDRRPALPVLDPHRSHRQARLVRPLVRVAFEPPGAPRRERPLHRPQLWRHLHGVGSPLRHVRRRVRTLRVRHARAAQLVGSAVGQPRGVCGPRAQVDAMRALERPRSRLAEAARLATGRSRWHDLAQAAFRRVAGADLRPADATSRARVCPGPDHPGHPRLDAAALVCRGTRRGCRWLPGPSR